MQLVRVVPFTFWWFVMITACLGLAAGMLIVGKKISDDWNKRILTFVGVGMLLDLFFMEGYLLYNELFAMSVSLPLAYCSIMEMFAIFAAIFKSKRCFEFVLFFGITGPLQAFLAPAEVVRGEEYIIVDYFLAHGLTIFIPIYMAVCMGFCPRKGSIFKVIFGMEVIAGFVYLINKELGSNYMYLIEKPEVSHILNVGVWPYYLLNWHVYLYCVAGFINGIFLFNRYLDKKTTGCL
jgi:hypothetical integral membrane protein (TIGR02206 family)